MRKKLRKNLEDKQKYTTFAQNKKNKTMIQINNYLTINPFAYER